MLTLLSFGSIHRQLSPSTDGPLGATRIAAALGLLGALVASACGHDKPLAAASGGDAVHGVGLGGAMAGAAGTTPVVSGVSGAGAGAGGATALDTSCDAIGDAPTIPPACATVRATRSTLPTGGPSDETSLDTAAIQAAIDGCPAGQSVRLASDESGAFTAFVSAPLALRDGVALWIDAGVTLFASRDPRDFDFRPGSGLCGGNGTGNASCRALINASTTAGSAVVGAGTIDGRGGEPLVGGSSTWWQLESMYGGELAAPRLVQTNGGTDFTLFGVTLRNSPKFHVVLQGTVGFKVWGITISTPPSAPNTDGVDPSATRNGVIAYCTISTGDDNVAVKGAGPVDGLIIAHNHFGRGHGMSIGSETNGGVRNVRVCDLSLDGTDNGIRIKSDLGRGGLVRGISYTDVCMRGVKRPLVFDPFYSSAAGNLVPDFADILVRNLHVLGGGVLTLRGRDAAHPLGLTLDNVVFDQPPGGTCTDADITLGPGPVSFVPSGVDIQIDRLSAPGSPDSPDLADSAPAAPVAPRDCSNSWVTF